MIKPLKVLAIKSTPIWMTSMLHRQDLSNIIRKSQKVLSENVLILKINVRMRNVCRTWHLSADTADAIVNPWIGRVFTTTSVKSGVVVFSFILFKFELSNISTV